LSGATGQWRPTGQAFLSDQLENGAGYCRELGQTERFLTLLGQADPTFQDSISSAWTEKEERPGAMTPHSVECDTSCNRCLRDFGTHAFQGLWDWGWALDMVRPAADGNTTIDLDSPWGNRENPWRRLCAGPGAPVPATLSRLQYTPVEFGPLRGYV